ncbi:MAG: GtrA family protein [Oscillibacter sp.]|nr:GtrA family protein [Oscillibacter sp.]
MEKLKALYTRYQDVIPYLFFGVCTTLVNMAAYWVAAYPLGLGVTASTVIAWVLAVLFAYVTNRRWVFHSEARTASEIGREIVSFFSCRLATGLVDLGCMFLFVDVLRCNDLIIKALDNVLVVVLNYVASKLLIFRKR